MNSTGIHARPASVFVQKAASFRSKIQIRAKGRACDAKSILMLMSMGLTCGTEVTIVADGSDEAQAVCELKALIDSGFGEDVGGPARKVSESQVPDHVKRRMGLR